MKKLLAILMAAVIAIGVQAIEITKVDKIQPNYEMFMDMAVSAAKKSVASNNVPSGAVIILNGAWKAAGTPEGDKTAEEVAVAKSHLTKLNNAIVFTVNEPTTATVNLLNSLGVQEIYFANPRDVAVAAGIYPASAYDDEALETTGYQAPMFQLYFPEAAELIGK